MKKPDIVFLDTETIGEVEQLQHLKNMGNLTVYKTTAHDQRIRHIGSHDVVITNKVMIDRQVMDACPCMKLVCIAATGMNNVDLDYASAKGIQVRNVAGYSTESVVQHTFALLFHLMNRLDYYDHYVKSGLYARSGMFTHHGRSFHELSGKIMGIIGLGTIGKRVAEIAACFGARPVYFSTTGNNLDQPFEHVSLEELLTLSDVVSIHCPLTEKTRNLLDHEQLKLMKKDAVLINTGRGGIVNETALTRAIDNNLLGGAGLDVLTREPPDADNPLLHVRQKEKLIITPHIAWAAVESRSRLAEGIIENIREFLAHP
ncbi:MAG: D-2-hydroxyacid dehydrogenase [Bacteroidales bacterium]|nr:D-2-hydroxyacid dehydrogenase [Bacteroidales bacterium]